MSPQTTVVFDFADFTLDLTERVLLHQEKVVPLTPKVFDTLQLLVENAGHLLEKAELMQQLWPDRFVEESNLTFNIKMLRKALKDDAAQPRFIETVPRRGYRFIAEVTRRSKDADQNRSVTPVKKPIHSRVFIGLVICIIVMVLGVALTVFLQSRPRGIAPLLQTSFSSEALSSNGETYQVAISQDGKSVVYLTKVGDRQGIWLRQLESANNIEIIPPSDDLYHCLALSPDGNFLYFNRRPRSVEAQLDVYRVSIFGGIPKKIVSETQGTLAISSDGKSIAYRRCFNRPEENCSLWVADAADGQHERKIVTRPRPIRIGDFDFSPDGRVIAFAVGQSDTAANEFSLVEVDLETGTEREVTKERFFNIGSLTWLPGENGLLITARKNTESKDRIWHISRESGQAVSLSNDTESYGTLSADRNGRLLVATQITQQFHLYLLNPGNPQSRRGLADAISGNFAPDGNVVFASLMSGNSEIWSVKPDGSDQRQLTSDPADDRSPLVSSDNNFVFFTSNRTGEAEIWRMNLDGSNQTQITNKEGGYPIAISANGRWLYYLHALQRQLWRVSTNGGDEQLVFDKRASRFVISPDGLLAAYAEGQGDKTIFTIFSIPDGRAIKSMSVPDLRTQFRPFIWLPDGSGLAYITESRELEKTLWSIGLDDSTPGKIASLGVEEISQSGLAISLDGKNFLVVSGGWRHDAVLIRGLK